MSADWQPTAAIAQLQQRAALLSAIRGFFAERDVLEVETPLLAHHTVTDPHLESLAVSAGGFLQTSPEYSMKRLLAAGSGCIYQIGKAFRADECGSRHNPEFTLLEWYRVGFDHHQLIAETTDLLKRILNVDGCDVVSYLDVFQDHLGINPHRDSLQVLESAAREKIDLQMVSSERDDWLNLLFAELIEPKLGWQRPVAVIDYPASMSALARLDTDPEGHSVARRFEIFVRGMELANGYHELVSAAEQARRFSADNTLRRQLGREQRDPDPALLAALEAGLPDCAGVALGVDRLMMLALGQGDIQSVIAFPWSRA